MLLAVSGPAAAQEPDPAPPAAAPAPDPAPEAAPAPPPPPAPKPVAPAPAEPAPAPEPAEPAEPAPAPVAEPRRERPDHRRAENRRGERRLAPARRTRRPARREHPAPVPTLRAALPAPRIVGEPGDALATAEARLAALALLVAAAGCLGLVGHLRREGLR